ncbi:MAG: hypothetical protein JXB05_28570 [Myxococcaceae bacterium]|nr:hypothetical protein [Myxococcaceae bacterium]
MARSLLFLWACLFPYVSLALELQAEQPPPPAGSTAVPPVRATLYLQRDGVNSCIPTHESRWDSKYDYNRFCQSQASTLKLDNYPYAVPDIQGNDSVVVVSEELTPAGARKSLAPSWIQVRVTIGHVFEDSVSEHPIKGYSDFKDGNVVYVPNYNGYTLTIPFRQYASSLKYHDRVRVTVVLFQSSEQGEPVEVDSAHFIFSYKEEPRPGFLEGALDVATLFPVYTNAGEFSLSANPALMYKIPWGTRYWRRYFSVGLIPAATYQVKESIITEGVEVEKKSTGFAIGAAVNGFGLTGALLVGTRETNFDRVDFRVAVGFSVVELVQSIDRVLKSSDANERARALFTDAQPRLRP